MRSRYLSFPEWVEKSSVPFSQTFSGGPHGLKGIACVIDGVDDLTTSTSVFEDLGLHLAVITSIFYGVGLLTFGFRIADRMGPFIGTAMVISIITALSLVRLKRRLCTGRWSRTQSLLEG
jgi:hypothetical protein